jgi:hypothetical protein
MLGALTLTDIQLAALTVTCRRCGRAGRYRVATLIEQHGGDRPLPDVARAIERASGCELAEKPYERCFVVFGEFGSPAS